MSENHTFSDVFRGYRYLVHDLYLCVIIKTTALFEITKKSEINSYRKQAFVITFK